MSKHVYLLPAPKHDAILKRIFTTTQKMIFWIALIGLIGINAHLTQPWINNLLTEAFIPDGSRAILGAQSDKTSASQNSGHYQQVTTQYAYWQSIVALHPDYRDGYYMLALLAYKLGKYTETKTYLMKVQTIDPNYPGPETLRALLPKE